MTLVLSVMWSSWQMESSWTVITQVHITVRCLEQDREVMHQSQEPWLGGGKTKSTGMRLSVVLGMWSEKSCRAFTCSEVQRLLCGVTVMILVWHLFYEFISKFTARFCYRWRNFCGRLQVNLGSSVFTFHSFFYWMHLLPQFIFILTLFVSQNKWLFSSGFICSLFFYSLGCL